MPRKLPATMTLDALEDEALFTGAALRADPDTATLPDRITPWIERIDAVRTTERRTRMAAADTDASRQVAGDRLRRSCIAFGDDLYLSVGKDRKSPRWRQFFPKPVSQFVRTGRGLQVKTVRGWLSSDDPVLVRHRPDLERWSQATDRALVDTSAVAIVRGNALQMRGALAEELTQERDRLHDELSAIARERGLARDWPDVFFRVDTQKADKEESGKTPEPEIPSKD